MVSTALFLNGMDSSPGVVNTMQSLFIGGGVQELKLPREFPIRNYSDGKAAKEQIFPLLRKLSRHLAGHPGSSLWRYLAG